MAEEQKDVTYKIGQVLFVLKNMSIQPIHVIEEVVKTTKHGTNKSWIVELKENNVMNRCDISSIKNEIFQNTDKLKKALISRATQAITNLVNAASEDAQRLFSIAEKPIQKKQEILDSQESKDVNVKLPDGSIAKLKI